MTDTKKPIIYVARDIERTLGKTPSEGYIVVTNDTPYGREKASSFPEYIHLVKGSKLLDTYELLGRDDVREIIKKYDAAVMVFQNTPRIERLLQKHKIELINPPAELARRIEEKISQIDFLDSDRDLLPPHRITKSGDVRYEGEKFVLQWNHAHTGEGTYIIDSSETLKKVTEKYPDRECRITRFVEGDIFTVNAIVGDSVVVGNPSIQITGLYPFTDLTTATIGNDWRLPKNREFQAVTAEVERIAERIGARMKMAGWRGLFGIDAIYDEKGGRTYLLEINARQPASTTFESILEKASGDGMTVFDAHIDALLGRQFSGPLLEIRDGAQIVQRVTRERDRETIRIDRDALKLLGLEVIEYNPENHNQDLVRIRSSSGIMESPRSLNDLGKKIASSLSNNAH